ncbi:uncharacterized protein HMPREF1541_02596 [Cyphellophora europaea CBS 101466]|uniref:Transmembrane protein 135 N-terminal domain-containing protein n=1 Tax=Cyphellophora europaea (strain CBS 101466) TaxID=1220924 RepID=W2S436_CYPE1|nr:uncharacterized protein HMPREF1541_02596 [Cyphellophora europaea CBS 101466]ETN43437.1 hypothetical protein HMPREF1541_02596 [Cyphellophora europaea CBS 101466]
MATLPPSRLVLSPREQEYLRVFLRHHLSDAPNRNDDTTRQGHLQNHSKSDSSDSDSFNAAAFRSASRVFITTSLSLKLVGTVLDRVTARSQAKLTHPQPRKPLVVSQTRLALSLSTLLFLHRVLFRLFSKLRVQLLHEKVRDIERRYPRVYAALTSKLAPAIGASLSGLALGIFPSDQLRLTIAIYIASRALEIGYTVLDAAGYMKRNPFGSWVLFALAQGQLLHAYVFDRDCFPQAYGSFIIQNTPEYIQRRPENLSPKVRWPSYNQISDALAEMARLRWPAFVSPILRPKVANTLPASIDPIISPITSRAHPALQHLSCALIHPQETSCFIAYLRQILLSFPKIAKFFTIYYSAMSLLKIRAFVKMPLQELDRLVKKILKTSAAITGAIGTSWGTICLFQWILPRAFLPQFRFFLGGLMGGSFQLLDPGSIGHGNSMYAARTSVDSLLKVGEKRRWWRPVRGGDVYLFVAALALINVCFDVGRDSVGKDRSMLVIRVLRGDIELGLQRGRKQEADSEKSHDE